ncbi:hypothetical protein FACS1894200_01090 [Spirochaetia bacterium]|nr:hypothetical protein FACS1894200_01090 [Spirochaetia bacterium]
MSEAPKTTLSSGMLVLRQRTPWEAVDSGVLLWKHNAAHFLPFFVLPFVLFACALRLLPAELTYFCPLFVWYAKPLFDRLALKVLAYRFFEPEASIIKLATSYSLFRGLIGDLLWRRFSPWRSSIMPLRVLEKLKRSQLKMRKRFLAHGSVNFCTIVTILCVFLEIVIIIGELGFLAMTLYIVASDRLDLIEGYADVEIYLYILYCFNYILIGSLYVCMGFGLYINSRIEVEGWDLELLCASVLKTERPV